MTARALRLAARDLCHGGRGLWVLCACIALGVALISAGAGMHRQVTATLLGDTRALFGGDLEIQSRAPLQPDVLHWMRQNADVSLLVELRTMMRSDSEQVQLVELQVTDRHYPLYGEVRLGPQAALSDVLALRNGLWGAAFDPALERRLALKVGDTVNIGSVALELRARIERQPDRSLRADWRGPPLMIAAGALKASGLVGPGSRIAYRYRVRVDGSVQKWSQSLAAAYPESDFEVRTFEERSERMVQVLDQVGSALLLVALSALFIGGLGVFNSVHVYLHGKLATIATLRAVGLRERPLMLIYLLQVMALALASSLAGALAGAGLALLAVKVAAERLPLTMSFAELALPGLLAVAAGLLIALTFTLPALGRALSVPTAVLFRGMDDASTQVTKGWWLASALAATLLAGTVVIATPQPLFGVAFVVVVLALLGLLELLVRALRWASRRLIAHSWLTGRFAPRLALSNLHRRGSPLRPSLLSLGTALTLLVTCALVVGALLRTINETIPERAPALAFYDIAASQIDGFRELIAPTAEQRLQVAPLVLGRLHSVNGVEVADDPDPRRALEARDEHKMSNVSGNFDDVIVERGQWWPTDYSGPPLVAMEDREADQIGLEVGDRLTFLILGREVEATLVAIYGQRRFQARLWLEAIFSPSVLDPFITRYVGAAYMSDEAALSAQARVATAMPNVVSVHTGSLLNEARLLLGRASAGLALMGGVTLLSSLLVLISVVASTRVRQLYDATVLHTLGATVPVIRRSLALEYALLAALTIVFSMLLGGTIASAFLTLRLELDGGAAWGLGASVAVAVSAMSLGLGAGWLLTQLRLSPAALLRAG